MANDINHIVSNTLHVGFENVHRRVELTDDRIDGGGIVLCRQIVRGRLSERGRSTKWLA